MDLDPGHGLAVRPQDMNQHGAFLLRLLRWLCIRRAGSGSPCATCTGPDSPRLISRPAMNRVAEAMAPADEKHECYDADQPPIAPRHRAPSLFQKPRDPPFQLTPPVEDTDRRAEGPGGQ